MLGYLAAQSAEACAAMAVSDAVTTALTVAEARGRDNLAGALDPVGTVARLIFYSYDGANILHGHGLWGWAFTAPIFAVDFFTTKYATRWSRRIKADAGPTG